ncbi:BLUF domain-containing protein [Curvibacter sp. APW13]|uniref:BLUF domain-containing protein n=1 Tax=Curvibacter sp. APW13 TaxID=3077236 RepID=UPI0028DE760A|nr:BLUF domain-containing protein [Curvibacter sp. APW13]MDT8990883.1 BLUF domain-containing protein [Curvibacter sp. APW13]
MDQPILQLVYSSRATEPFNSVQMEALLEGARRFNAEHDITGMLLYADGHFLQVLEGPQETVETLLARIDADPRHDHVRVLLRSQRAHRDFPDWHMAYHLVDEATRSTHPELAFFFSDDFSAEHFLPWSTPVGYLLLAFRAMSIQAPAA